MKQELNNADFLTLIYWVKTYLSLENRDFKYQNILNTVLVRKRFNIPLDTNIDDIDDLILDAYKLYLKINSTKDRVLDIMSTMGISNVSNVSTIAKDEIEQYGKIVEDLLENYKFKNDKVREIQKDFSTQKMKDCVDIEDYENAARFRDLIKEY